MNCKACGMGLIGWKRALGTHGGIIIPRPSYSKPNDSDDYCDCPCGLRWKRTRHPFLHRMRQEGRTEQDDHSYEIIAGTFKTDFHVAMCDLEHIDEEFSGEQVWWDGIWDAYIEDPNDTTALLIFADWLDEQDDPRGELIRLGVEMHGPGPPDEYYPVYRHYTVVGRYYRLRLELGYQPGTTTEQAQIIANGAWLDWMEKHETALTPINESTSQIQEELTELGIRASVINTGRVEAARIYSKILQKQGKGP